MPVGTLNQDISEELKARLKGKIALIDRGEISFVEKFKKLSSMVLLPGSLPIIDRERLLKWEEMSRPYPWYYD